MGVFYLAGTTLALASMPRLLPIAPADWMQANENGFGNPDNLNVQSLEAFNGQIYATTRNVADHGQLWRTSEGLTWTQVISSGFWGVPTDTLVAPLDMIEFQDQLYLGITDIGPGQVWRSPDGEVWTQVEGARFDNPNNLGINTFAVFQGLVVCRHDQHRGGNRDLAQQQRRTQASGRRYLQTVKGNPKQCPR